MKEYFGTLRNRLKACWRILTGRWDHFAILGISSKSLSDLVIDEEGDDNKEIEMETNLVGLPPYGFFLMIQLVSNSQDDIDIALHKAEFMAGFEEYNQKQHGNNATNQDSRARKDD